MYSCPKCGALMRFDIPTQALACDYCGNSCAVNEHPEQLKEAERTDYDVTVFSCPQCGGEIRSTGNEATEFCPFCGSSVTLEGRFTAEKKPERIVPFALTKENCKEIYRKNTQNVWCLPKELKNPDHLEKFTGIYLPYWIYHVEQNGPVLLKATHTSGQYIEHCNLSFNLDNDYAWIPMDAASSFDDDLSDVISSYTKEKSVEFSSAYLSGFYADAADVSQDIYAEDALEEASYQTFEGIRKKVPNFSGYSIIKPDNLKEAMHSRLAGTGSALCPVWFLTWRDKSRVAYAVVNGDDGTMTADYPVDTRRYLLFSLLMAIPLAVIFFNMPVMTASAMLAVALILGMVTMLIQQATISAAAVKDLHLFDKGRLGTASPKNPGLLFARSGRLRHKKSFSFSGIGSFIFLAAFLFIAASSMMSGSGAGQLLYALGGFTPMLGIAAIIVSAVMLYNAFHAASLLHDGRIITETLLITGLVCAASLIIILKPVHDYFYYFGVVMILAGCCMTFVLLIRRYNQLCTRPIPEYHEREVK